MNDKIKIIQTIHILEYKTHPRDCKICSVIQCPKHNPYHLNKQGCPDCQPQLMYLCLGCGHNSVDLKDGEELCEKCLEGNRKRLKRYAS